jgi:hypothetical protein
MHIMMKELLLLAKLLLFGHVCALVNFLLWYVLSRDLYKIIREKQFIKNNKQSRTSDTDMFPTIEYSSSDEDTGLKVPNFKKPQNIFASIGIEIHDRSKSLQNLTNQKSIEETSNSC